MLKYSHIDFSRLRLPPSNISCGFVMLMSLPSEYRNLSANQILSTMQIHG